MDLELTSPKDSKEKPFTCPVCEKSFARRDVCHRHIRTHRTSLFAPLLRRQNVVSACTACHNRKVKCHPSERPCPRCKLADLVCNFPQEQARDLDSASNSSGAPPFPSPDQLRNCLRQSDSIQDDSIAGPSFVDTGSIVPDLLQHNNSIREPCDKDRPPGQTEPQTSVISDLTRINASALSEAQQFGQFNFWETDPYMMLLDENPLDSFPRPQDGFFDDLTAVRITLE